MNAMNEKPSAVAPAAASATPAPKRGRAVRRAIRAGIAVIALAAASVTAVWWAREGRWIESTDNAYVQGDIAVLGPRIEGDVVAVHVQDNQHVRRGDKLISLDPEPWQARLDEARGAADEAAAAILTVRQQVEQARSAVVQADAMIAQADAEWVRANADARRSGTLATAGWASRQDNEHSVAEQRKAAAGLEAARAQKESAMRALSVVVAQVAQAEARKITADAVARRAARDLDDTVILAPFDGVVGNRTAQLGQHVMPQLQLISVTPERARLYVVANFKETQLRRMQPGQPVRLVPDIDTSMSATGRVESLAPATGALFSLLPPENATGNFTKVVQRVPTRIVLDPAEAARATWLRAGLSVTADVDTRPHPAPLRGVTGTALALLGLE